LESHSAYTATVMAKSDAIMAIAPSHGVVVTWEGSLVANGGAQGSEGSSEHVGVRWHRHSGLDGAQTAHSGRHRRKKVRLVSVGSRYES